MSGIHDETSTVRVLLCRSKNMASVGGLDLAGLQTFEGSQPDRSVTLGESDEMYILPLLCKELQLKHVELLQRKVDGLFL